MENNPLDPAAGTREVAFSGSLWIEADDFLADAGAQVQASVPRRPGVPPEGRLSHHAAPAARRTKTATSPRSLAEYDPDSRGGDPADGRKVKGATIHWVDAATAVDAEVRLYDNLFTDANPDAADKDFMDCLNPDSLEVLTDCKVEAGLAAAADRYAESHEGGKRLPASSSCAWATSAWTTRTTKPGHLVFNRSVSLKDSFKK